ncbi:hypothetical protein DFQ13_10669 [Actinokineospora spheciospongiae]|nr:hypothetical protein DFQ13_10669 [Actinokineospora spheciospongiae]
MKLLLTAAAATRAATWLCLTSWFLGFIVGTAV